MSLVKRGGNNPFYSPDDDMDDDAFLNHPRAGSSGYMLPQSSSMTSTSPRPNSSQSTTNTVENRQNQLQLERHEIEQRTIDSSNRSLGLLFESERVGAATGEELSRQKEQLLRTEGRLDDINSTLKTSERHLQGIKSVFGGIKNYLFARNNGLPAPQQQSGGGQMSQSNSDVAISSSRMNQHHYQPDNDFRQLDTLQEEQNHPGLRQRGLIEQDHSTGSDTSKNLASVDAMLDANLDEMAMGLSRLKGLAIDLNSELDDHDDILGRLDDKAAHAGIKVTKQTKDMTKLLKK